MTVYEKFYKNDDHYMIAALADHLSSYTDCDVCQLSELCKNHNNELNCKEIFYMWLQKEADKDA